MRGAGGEDPVGILDFVDLDTLGIQRSGNGVEIDCGLILQLEHFALAHLGGNQHFGIDFALDHHFGIGLYLPPRTCLYPMDGDLFDLVDIDTPDFWFEVESDLYPPAYLPDFYIYDP